MSQTVWRKEVDISAPGGLGWHKDRRTDAWERDGITIAKELNKVCNDILNNLQETPHYTKGKIKVLDFILDQQFDYLAGQVIKYISRYRHKGQPVEDLQKARFYLERLIKEVYHA